MKFRFSSEFGAMEEVRNGRPHNGIDIAMPEGTELHAIMEGTVERITNYGDENIGTGLIVKLEDGTRAIYGHLNDVKVEVGDKIEAGDLIALSGNTGHSSGPHLHFGLWKDGEYLNPTDLADELMESSGKVAQDIPWWDFEARARNAVNGALDEFQEGVGNQVELWLGGVLDGLGDFIFESMYSVSLLAGGVMILLRVAGWKDGFKWTGVVFTVNALIKYLFGGMSA